MIDDKEIDAILGVLMYIGKDRALEARRKAMSNMTNESIETHGTLLGGKLTIKLEFENSNDLSPHESPDPHQP